MVGSPVGSGGGDSVGSEYGKLIGRFRRFGLGRAQALARLLEVAFDGGIGGGTVLHCIAEGEDWFSS